MFVYCRIPSCSTCDVVWGKKKKSITLGVQKKKGVQTWVGERWAGLGVKK